MRNERALLAKIKGKELTVGYLMEINGDWCFYREVVKDKDMLKKFNAWSIQASILPVLEEDSIAWIYLWDKQAKRMSRIKFADFKEKAVERDFGAGRQLYVSEKYFEPMPGMERAKRKYINSVELVA